MATYYVWWWNKRKEKATMEWKKGENGGLWKGR